MNVETSSLLADLNSSPPFIDGTSLYFTIFSTTFTGTF